MKSGIVGFGILASLIAASVVIPIYAPYDVVRQWSSVEYWLENPRWAAPEWVTIFTGKNEPRTTVFDPSSFRYVIVRDTIVDQNGREVNLTFITATRRFLWTYDNFPSEISLYIKAFFPGNTSTEPGSSPLVSISLRRPDNQTVQLLGRAVPGPEFNRTTTYHLSSSTGAAESVFGNIRKWVTQEGVLPSDVVAEADILPHVALFARNDTAQLNPARSAHLLQGQYELRIEYVGFSLNDTLEPRARLYGTVFGLMGTDERRRDLLTGVLWGAPIAMAFGSAAAIVVVLSQTILGALSGWYRGPVDEAIQRFADLYLIIPVLPILIIIALLYRPSIVAILFVVVAFGIVGSTTKVVRSIVLQIREEQFIEAAQSYGASRIRILFRYILPRVMPYTFALVALNVPIYIFLEASLSFLGLGDPTLPTWGSIIGQAYTGSALTYGFWWWVAFPTLGIVYTAVGFALVGYAFDKVINPRLREE